MGHLQSIGYVPVITTGGSVGSMSERAHIIVVDDHAVARKTICALLRAEPDFAVICDVTNGADAVIHARQLQPDVVVLDISMPGKNGFEVLKDLRLSYPKLKVLMLSMHPEDRFAVRAIKGGAVSCRWSGLCA